MFEKDASDKDEDAKEKVLNRRIEKSLDRPEIVEESQNIVSDPTKQPKTSYVGGYLSELQRKDGGRLKFTH
jgi:hypothetical protein